MIEQDPQARRQLLDVTHAVEQSCLSVLDEFAPRAEIRGNNSARLRIGLEDRFAERLVGVRR